MLCNQWDSKHIYLLAKYPTGYKLVFLMPISVVYFYAYYFVSPLLQNVSLFVSFTAVGWGSTSWCLWLAGQMKGSFKSPCKRDKTECKRVSLTVCGSVLSLAPRWGTLTPWSNITQMVDCVSLVWQRAASSPPTPPNKLLFHSCLFSALPAPVIL